MPDPRDYSRSIEQPAVLLVEGMDEFSLLLNLLEHLRIAEIDICSYEGKDKLRPCLDALKIRDGFTSVLKTMGILRDADDDADAAFASVVGALSAVGLPAPSAPGEFIGEKPRVGVFILPGNGQSGSLETICWPSKAGLEKARQEEDDASQPAETVPAVEVEACVTSYVKCLQEKAVRLPRNLDKTSVHTYLAAHRKPGLRIGEAAEAGCWDFHHEAWEPIKQFIHAM